MTQLIHPAPPAPSSSSSSSSSSNPAPPAKDSPPEPIDILILGHGWTSQHHLVPLLIKQNNQTVTTAAATHNQHEHKHRNLTYAYTTRSGRGGSIAFTFDPDTEDDDDLEPYKVLPAAKNVLVTFPLKGAGQSRRLVRGYERTHTQQQQHPRDENGGGNGNEGNVGKVVGNKTRWIQLGSTGIFKAEGWNDSSSPYDGDDPYTPGGGNQRAVAEDELLSLCGSDAVVMDLAGLYDGETRRPREWVGRVMRSKEDVKKKGALHLVHGGDVARGIVGILLLGTEAGERVGGRRWIVTDLRVYDWWDLAMSWGSEGEYRRWVVELMREEGVRALPREKGELGRVLDGRAFWEAIGSWPGEGRVT